jgi:hypothetical protein
VVVIVHSKRNPGKEIVILVNGFHPKTMQCESIGDLLSDVTSYVKSLWNELPEKERFLWTHIKFTEFWRAYLNHQAKDFCQQPVNGQPQLQ